MHKSLTFLTAIMVLACWASFAPVHAQDRVRIAWAGSTPSNTPTWVADQKGFLKKNGLQAELINISASTIVIQALLTGEVDMTIGTSATLVTSRLAGSDTYSRMFRTKERAIQPHRASANQVVTG